MEPDIYWQDLINDLTEVVLYPAEAVLQLNIPEDAREFLTHTGLPDSAAPFLSFSVPESGEPLPTVAEQSGLGSEYAAYAVIGHSGSGDPIAIATDGSGTVVCFNHDNDFEKVFVNTSVRQFAESLKAYAEFVRKTRQLGGPDALAGGNIPPHLGDWITARLTEIDPPALQPGCHWWWETGGLTAGECGPGPWWRRWARLLWTGRRNWRPVQPPLLTPRQAVTTSLAGVAGGIVVVAFSRTVFSVPLVQALVWYAVAGFILVAFSWAALDGRTWSQSVRAHNGFMVLAVGVVTVVLVAQWRTTGQPFPKWAVAALIIGACAAYSVTAFHAVANFRRWRRGEIREVEQTKLPSTAGK